MGASGAPYSKQMSPQSYDTDLNIEKVYGLNRVQTEQIGTEKMLEIKRRKWAVIKV